MGSFSPRIGWCSPQWPILKFWHAAGCRSDSFLEVSKKLPANHFQAQLHHNGARWPKSEGTFPIATTGSQLGPKKIPGVWCHLGGLHLPTMACQCTPAAPCHAPCVSHPNPTWPRRQPSQHPLSQAPVQPPTGHRLGATRCQGKPPGWQGLCSRGLGPRGGHTTGALAPNTPGLAKRAFCRCTLVPQRGGFLRQQPTAPPKIPRAAA